MASLPRKTVVAALVLLTTAACTNGHLNPVVTSALPAPTSGTATHPQILEVRAVNNLGSTRLAEGVMAPTNRWYSSLAFGKGGLPVYPKPLAVTPVDGGFALGLTTPVASADAIMAAAMTTSP